LLRDASSAYWIKHGVGTGVLLVTAGASSLIPRTPGELRSPTATALSNATLTLELIAPIPTLAATTSRLEFARFGLVYGQTILGALTLNNLLRPIRADSSALLAFAFAYSASASFDRQRERFTSSRRVVSVTARDVFWGFELGLATLTGTLDGASGRATGYGVLTGAVLGTGFGVLVQAAHEGAEWRRGPSEHWGYSAIGLVGCGLLGQIPRLRPWLTTGVSTASLHGLRLAPVADATGASGLMLSGGF
jgi:hypothetical protein